MSEKLKIVFFDGGCGLCQRSISFLAEADKEKQLRFAPINGETYLSIYKKPDHNTTTLRFYLKGATYEKSDAFIKIGSHLGGGYKLLSIILLIAPKFLRDKIYDFVANERTKIKCVIIDRDDRFLN
jgi:predicted DCC family thiol-disulfide oxidoreductase YuxK